MWVLLTPSKSVSVHEIHPMNSESSEHSLAHAFCPTGWVRVVR